MQNRPRIPALDLLRGYFLVVIFTDHLFRFPNIFEFISGRGQLWVSAAEGFFLISGLLVGYIYWPKISQNFKAVFFKLWRRAGQLYLVSVFLTLFFTLWGTYLPPNQIKSGLWAGGNLANLLYKTATFQYVYGWADFLVFYTVFMLAAPLALGIIKKFNVWTLLIISLGIWYLFRLVNYFSGWQLIFMVGLAAGCYLPALEKKLRRNIFILSGITILTLGLSVYILATNNTANAIWFDKTTVGPGRVVLAIIWFSTFYIFARTQEEKINNLSWGVLTTLGQNSLLTYSLESVLLFPINVIFPDPAGFAKNSLIIAGSVALIYFFIINLPIMVKLINEIKVLGRRRDSDRIELSFDRQLQPNPDN